MTTLMIGTTVANGWGTVVGTGGRGGEEGGGGETTLGRGEGGDDTTIVTVDRITEWVVDALTLS